MCDVSARWTWTYYYYFLLLFFSVTVCHTLCHCCCRCCWSNFHLANNNGISGAMAMGMVIHISKTCRMSLNHFHITVKRSFSMRSSLSKHLLIYFSVFHFSPSSVYERFCSFFYLFIYLFSYSFGSPSCLLFIFVCRFLWHWLFVECCLCRSDVLTAPRKGQKDERTEKKIFETNRILHWHHRFTVVTTDTLTAHFPCYPTDRLLTSHCLQVENDAMPSWWWKTSRCGCHCYTLLVPYGGSNDGDVCTYWLSDRQTDRQKEMGGERERRRDMELEMSERTNELTTI